jgi:hypothetical protein
MQLFLKTLTGKTLTLDVEGHHDVVDVLRMAQDSLSCCPNGINGCCLNGMQLVFAGRQLELDRGIMQAGIGHESTLHLLTKPRGCQGCRICRRWRGTERAGAHPAIPVSIFHSACTTSSAPSGPAPLLTDPRALPSCRFL